MRKWIIGAVVAVLGTVANAATVSGLEFSFVTDFDYPSYGYITSGAENINYGGAEFSTGFSEFNISGLKETDHAVLTFQIGSERTTTSIPFYPYGGIYNLYAYAGTNVASRNAFTASRVGLIGTFDLYGHGVGSAFSFDVTSLFNTLLATGAPAFGLHFVGEGPFGSAPRYEDVTFTSTLLTVAAVPEPESYALLVLGFACIGARRAWKSPRHRTALRPRCAVGTVV
jgi:hypothetical protein